MEFLTEDETRDKIRDMINSWEWWIFPNVSESSVHLSAMVEETYYRGDANGDFHIMLFPMSGMGAISFAHKRRMSAEQLAAIAGRDVARTLKQQDIVVALDVEDEEDQAAAVMQWHAWVMGTDGWKPVTRNRG